MLTARLLAGHLNPAAVQAMGVERLGLEAERCRKS